MSNGFVHSVKVPRLYKTAATIARTVHEDGCSLKNLIYAKKHPNVSGIYALTSTTLQKRSQLDELIRTTGILLKEPRLDPWLARVLLTELLWGKKCLQSECKPVQTVLSYENQLREAFGKLDDTIGTKAAVRIPRYVRVNTIFISVDDGISAFIESGWSLIPKCTNYSQYLSALKNLSQPHFMQDFHIPELLVFPQKVTFYDHEGYLKGEIILQDKASCLVAHLLNPEPGSVVLDLCAAPGMKTTHVAAKLQNKGKVYAVEMDIQRYSTLREEIALTDSVCVECINKDALDIDQDQCPNVDYILVDPSCSGSGMISRIEEEYSPERLVKLQIFQKVLLRHALLDFPTVKRVIYSTCSIHPEENEVVVDETLRRVGDAYTLVSPKDLLGDNWVNYGSTKYWSGDKCLYTKTDVDSCNGFFIAVFERNFEVPLIKNERKAGRPSLLEQPMEPTEATEPNKLEKRKKRGKKKRKGEDVTKETEVVDVGETLMQIESEPVDGMAESILPDEAPLKKKKRKKEQPEIVDDFGKIKVPAIKVDKHTEGVEIIDERPTCEMDLLENIAAKKKKKKKREKRKCADDGDPEVIDELKVDHSKVSNDEAESISTEDVYRKKKKKQKKKKSTHDEVHE